MGFPKANQELAEFLIKSIAKLKTGRRDMFGCPAFFAGDNMFPGIFGDSMTLRLPEDERQAFMAEHPGVGLFEPFPGRPMREYMALPGELARSMDDLQEWLNKSWNYAASLPPKKKKAKKKK